MDRSREGEYRDRFLDGEDGSAVGVDEHAAAAEAEQHAVHAQHGRSRTCSASVTAKSLPDMLSVLATASEAASAAQNRVSTTASAGAASSISTPPPRAHRHRRTATEGPTRPHVVRSLLLLLRRRAAGSNVTVLTDRAAPTHAFPFSPGLTR
uniref:Uncharacterized protein n=2 Tax=Arundo donax TaxID=35708 RepID=A0A0A9DCU9_ARUDO